MDLGSLQIRQSQETDQGKYECVAENSLGTEYSYSAQLYVRGKREKFGYGESSNNNVRTFVKSPGLLLDHSRKTVMHSQTAANTVLENSTGFISRRDSASI